MLRQYLRVSVGFFLLALAMVVSPFAQTPNTNTVPPPAPADQTSASINRGEVEYLPVPPSTKPLNSLLPRGGMEQHPSWGYLKFPEKNLLNSHEVDFESREVRVHSLYYNTQSKDTMNMWTAYYQELATYTFDMYDFGFRRLWLNSLIGQKEGGAEATEGSLFDISIPVNMPAWMKDLGLDKPKLQLEGTMDIRLKGYGETDDAPGATESSLWPSPSLDYEPSFLVKGKIGRNITVEINNTESGLGVRNQLRIIYAEATPGEFEDYILQRVELGTTSLSLKGTELTGYSENHQGLFGLKADFKIGDWWLTAIASQDAGSSEKYTMRASESSTEFQLQDKQFLAYRYYFLNHTERTNYISKAIREQSTQSTPPANLKLYKRSPINNDKNLLRDMDAVYTDPDGKKYTKSKIPMVEMTAQEWSWDTRTGTIRVENAGRNSLIAASWSGDGTNRTGSTLRSGQTVVLIQDDNSGSSMPKMDKLMLRNIYTVGITSSTAGAFILRMKNQSQGAGDYLKTLGLVDSADGSVLTGDPDIFTKDGNEYTGEMWIPCRPQSWYINRQKLSQADAIQRATTNCLEPMRNLDSTGSMATLYETPAYNLNRVSSRYYFETVGKKRQSSINVRDPNSSFSVSSGNCIDIAPNSEQLKIGSSTLQRDVDYQVNYELGQIELISERALNPNNEITVTYECTPLFEIENKILLGLRAEYPIRALSDKSLLGLTALYKSQNTTQEQPRYGGEPFSSVLLGANIFLQDSARWMDRFINAFPFIDTKVKSTWTAEAELAGSYHNANTSTNKSALLDDFESSSRSLQYSMYRTYWYNASPPGGTSEDLATFHPQLDYQHAGEFIWHSNQDERYRNVYTEVGNSDVDSRELSILKFTLRPNDNLEGNSWGGIMRSNGLSYQDLSNMRYLEVVARGNVGNLFVDLGAISEDLSISGLEPNGEINGEATANTTTPLNDCGLDGVCSKDGAMEKRRVWDCRIEPCMYSDDTSGSNKDKARDDFAEQEDDSDPDVHINGTENNNGSGERDYDTEDLNRDGSLDTENRFVRYRINLESTSGTDYETLKNGWRRWRIPLTAFDTVIAKDGSNYQAILGDARMTRLWYGRLKHGVVEGQAQVLEMRVVGNQWEETAGANEYGIVTQGPTQTVIVDGIPVEVTAPGQVIVPDTNYLRVRVINNRDNTKDYYKSPNTVTERDAETNAALKEQSLVLQFGGLNPGQAVGATRYFDTESKDLTQYQRIKLEIHMQNQKGMALDTIPVRLAIQLGHGGLEGSDNYYEWSFRPAMYREAGSERPSDAHERNWLANAMDIPISEFVNLKDGRMAPFLTPVERARTGDFAREREERLKLVGNPSMSRINWVRFVIIADEGATANQVLGEFWVNDLRLSGLSTEWGLAGRVRGQLDFGDVMSVSGELRYKDGDFATLKSEGKSPKPTLAESNSQLDINGNFSFNLNKFFKDEWQLRMPLSLGYSATVRRPYLKPQSDQPLTKDNYSVLAPELVKNELEFADTTEEAQKRRDLESKGYQSYSRSRSLSLGFSKEHTEDESWIIDYMTQAFLERPALNYRYNEIEARSTTSADSSYTYGATLDYKLGTYKPFALRPVESMAALTIEPWPQTFDITLFDMSYMKTIGQERDPEFVANQVPRTVEFSTELQHKMNVRWNLFPFLSATYSLSVRRDMEGGGDREAFVKENFFSPNSPDGMFAKNVIFDYDHNDRRIYTTPDSVVVTENRSKRKPRIRAPGDTIPAVEGDTNTYIPGYDTTVYYRIDSVGSRDFGRAYGILRNERSRQQDFKLNFNPQVIPFLVTRFGFGSTFQQNKTIPDNFRIDDPAMREKNFWSIDHTNRFEFTPTLKLVELFGWGNTNAMTSFLEKLRWREIRSSWSVDLKTTGEDFTFAQLHDEQGVTPGQYYLYGLGFGDGYGARNPWDLMTGDMLLTRRTDFEDFAEYRNKHVDTLVYRSSFLHSVSRRLTLGTNFTLPFWDIGVTTDGQWSEEFRQPRQNPFYLDTITVWPKWGVGVSVPNFAERLAFVKPYLRSLSASHRTDYTYTRSVKPFQSAEDEWRTQWAFMPLIRLSALTNGNIRIDNDINYSTDYSLRRPKVQVVPTPGWPDVNAAAEDTSMLYVETPWMHTDRNESWAYTLGDELSIGYDLKTKRGFQIFKWYWRLKNDINLKLNTGWSFEKTRYRETPVVTGFTPLNAEPGSTSGEAYTLPIECSNGGNDCHVVVYSPAFAESIARTPTRKWEYYIRPNAAYQFNKMASMSAFMEYRYIREKLSDGDVHNVQILQFEIALMLRFE